MADYLEHSDRANHHRQPRRVVNHWGTDGWLHPGADPAECETCAEWCESCNGPCRDES